MTKVITLKVINMPKLKDANQRVIKNIRRSSNDFNFNNGRKVHKI